MDGLFHQINVEDTKEIEDASDLEDHLENLTEAPTPNVLESQVGHSTKTKFTAMDVKNQATCRKIVLITESNPHKRGQPWPKKFEDYTYTYSGPDIQPQMQINPVNPKHGYNL